MRVLLKILSMLMAMMTILPPGAAAQDNGSPESEGKTYSIPFASTGNYIELTVVNPSAQPVRSLTVRAEEVPSWMSLYAAEQAIGELGPGEETSVRFGFDVAETAGVNQPASFGLSATAPGGFRQQKQISLQVEAPREFELRQNYPNPFNPSTTIAFQLPSAAEIRLEVFDVLGRRVTTLLAGESFQAGGHVIPFDGAGLASGLYLYRLSGQTTAGRSFVQTKKMLMVK